MSDPNFMQLALHLARRGYGTTSPNPMVGAVLVKGSQVIGRGWHRQAGGDHAEIDALRDARERGHSPRGATLYVTLEPCCTHGRTPPCTKAIIAAGVKRVVAGAIDPNPKHAGRAFAILRRAGIRVDATEDAECDRLNEAFNHWIVHRTPFVTVKAAMTLDGKIATASGESKWITSKESRAFGMKLRRGNDAILVGINTVLADNPSLTARMTTDGRSMAHGRFRRIVFDSLARTPLTAKVASDKHAALTTVVVSKLAPQSRVAALARRVKVVVAPLVKPTPNAKQPSINPRWLLQELGAGNVTSLLVEGGGEVNASFLLGGFAQRVMFFYAPKIIGGRDSRKGVAGDGVKKLSEAIQLREVQWHKLGSDLLLTARVSSMAD